jgi:hypothetical protein
MGETERDTAVTFFFGDRWDAPQVDDATQVDTPVGQSCLFCAEPIEPGDRGLLRHYVRDIGPTDVDGIGPVHMECDLRMGLGIVAHLEGRCSCAGAPAVEPPGRPSFRVEARETLTWINARRAARGAGPL